MTKREKAIINYVEFGLIGLAETLKPYMRDDADMQDVFKIINELHKDLELTIGQSSGLPTDIN